MPRLMTPCCLLILLGLVDMATTLYFHQATRWLGEGYGIEWNPLAARVLGCGIGWLILFKLACLAGPILVLEWAKRQPVRRIRPGWAEAGAWLGLMLYVLVWGMAQPTAWRDWWEVRQLQAHSERPIVMVHLRHGGK